MARGTTFSMACFSLQHRSCFLLDRAASHTAGAVAEQAADRKCSHTDLSSTHEFQPVAIESLSDTTASFLEELGRKITHRSGEPLEPFLFQRVNVLVQRFNVILFRETFSDEDDTDT